MTDRLIRITTALAVVARGQNDAESGRRCQTAPPLAQDAPLELLVAPTLEQTVHAPTGA